MTFKILPPFPVDEVTLMSLEHALDTCRDHKNDEGEWVLTGGEYTLSQLLDFMSGYDPELVQPVEGESDVEEYVGGQIYHPNDVIRSLLVEVRRLRTGGPH